MTLAVSQHMFPKKYLQVFDFNHIPFIQWAYLSFSRKTCSKLQFDCLPGCADTNEPPTTSTSSAIDYSWESLLTTPIIVKWQRWMEPEFEIFPRLVQKDGRPGACFFSGATAGFFGGPIGWKVFASPIVISFVGKSVFHYFSICWPCCEKVSCSGLE